MHHTGTLFMSKARAEARAGAGVGGAFQLTLQLIDRMGTHETQVYRVRWEGPEAQAFWQEHGAQVTPGAVLHTQLTHLRVHVGATFPPVPELRGRVVSLQMGVPRGGSTGHGAALAKAEQEATAQA